jgi:hypothetical protein
MNTENRPYAERKFLVVVREPGLLEQVVDLGTWLVVPIVKLGWEAFEKIKQRGLPALIQVTASDVTSLVFPPGHPEIGTVYTAHPVADSPRYYVTATFHQCLFEERVAEFARVMRCAGAMKLTIDAERRTGGDADAMVKLRAAIAAVDPKLRVRQTSSTNLSISFRGGHGKPTELPPDLLFFKHEPTWRDAYDAALTSGIESYEAEVETKDDFGLDAKIAGEFFKHGFSIGGKYESHVYYRLRATVDFRQGA